MRTWQTTMMFANRWWHDLNVASSEIKRWLRKNLTYAFTRNLRLGETKSSSRQFNERSKTGGVVCHVHTAGQCISYGYLSHLIRHTLEYWSQKACHVSMLARFISLTIVYAGLSYDECDRYDVAIRIVMKIHKPIRCDAIFHLRYLLLKCPLLP